jgi:hypothetical protein
LDLFWGSGIVALKLPGLEVTSAALHYTILVGFERAWVAFAEGMHET